MQFGASRKVSLWFLFWISGLSCSLASDELRTIENDYFAIVGEDLQSVYYAEELSQYVVQATKNYLGNSDLRFAQRILVNLRPSEYVDFNTPFRVSVHSGGFVTLDFNWSKQLSLQECIRGISEALLTRYVFYEHGPDAVRSMKQWPVSAVSTATYLRLRPAMWGELAATLQFEEVHDLNVLLSPAMNSDFSGPAGYWLLHALNDFGFNQELEILFRYGLQGQNVLPMITQLTAPIIEELEIEGGLNEWWAGVAQGLAGKPANIYEDMRTSGEWIKDLSSFIRGEEPLNLRELWDYKEDPMIRDSILARYELLRLRLPRVNPAYFNAARSLGALFESLLANGPIYEYIGHMSEFLVDYEDTQIMEGEIIDRLGLPRI